MKMRRERGFTLVEVLIVVVIMAVLAATIIPQFTNSTQEAKENTALFNLHTLRSQIELYKANHAGKVPTITLVELTSKTDASGAVSATGVYGPYLREVPKNPINDLNTVEAGTGGAGDGSSGWQYNAATGQIWLDDATLYNR